MKNTIAIRDAILHALAVLIGERIDLKTLGTVETLAVSPLTASSCADCRRG